MTTPPMSHLRLLLIAAASLATACTRGDGSAGSSTTRDSAEIRIVESTRPEWSASDAWQLDPAPILDLGAPQDEHLFFAETRGLVRLSNGTVVIAERVSGQLRFFDSAGKFVRRTGNNGRGPGEFTFLHHLYRCGGDTLIAVDNVQSQIFDSAGRFVRVVPALRPPGIGAVSFLGASGNCSQVAVSEYGVNKYGGAPPELTKQRFFQQPIRLWWLSVSGDLIDSITSVNGARSIMYQLTPDGAPARGDRPWGGAPVFATASDRLYVGFPDDFEIRSYDPSGVMRDIFRVKTARAPITKEDQAEFERGTKEWLSRNKDYTFLMPPLEPNNLPPFKPAFSQMIVADDGTIWVREIAFKEGGHPLQFPLEPGDPPVKWNVLASNGKWLGSVSVPAGFDVYAISSNAVYGMYHDHEADRIRAYRIVKPSHEGPSNKPL
jgi:hypothetical protein